MRQFVPGVAAAIVLCCQLEAHAQPFLHYTFDGTGATANGHVFPDASDSGNDGTFVDTGTLGDTGFVTSPAAFGQAWSDPTEANDDRIELTTPFTPGASAPWTIAFWHGMSGGASVPLFDHNNTANSLSIHADASNVVVLVIAGQPAVTWPTPGIISQGGFYHFVIVADPAGIAGVDADASGTDDHVALYVDGVLITLPPGQNVDTYGTNVTATSYGDGNSDTGTFGNGHGVNDELWIIANYALDAAQIAQLRTENVVCLLGDTDGDGRSDDCDNCPFIGNSLQSDDDGDGAGNVCDAVNDDVDGDGVGNGSDNCPAVSNAAQADADQDGLGDACDATDDRDVDADGDLNADDNCPFVANADQADADGDGLGDVCDAMDGLDVDEDGALNADDNCPFVANADQADADGDGLGDLCDPANGLDVDGDTVSNTEDNCPFVTNGDQADADGDGIGDACDDANGLDLDGDGIANADDNCAFDSNADQADLDTDGTGDACDAIDDTPPADDGCSVGGGSTAWWMLLVVAVVVRRRRRESDGI